MLHSIDHNGDGLPPHSIESEMCLLASMMIDHEFAREVIPTLSRSSFFLADHAIIFDAIAGLLTSGRPVDAIILRDELKTRSQLEKIGGSAYVAQLLSLVPSAAHAHEYAARVREHEAARSLIGAAESTLRRVYAGQDDVAKLSADLADAAAGILASRSAGQILSYAEVVDRAYDSIAHAAKNLVPTGLWDLDAMIGGIGPGEMVIGAGRPSMGKSTFGRSIADNVARTGVPVGIISLEESPEKIGRNGLSGESGIDNERLRKGQNLTREEWETLAKSANRMRKLPIHVSRQARTIDEVRAVAATMVKKLGCRLLVIDYLGRIRAPGASIYERVTYASGALSDMVKDLGTGALVLCQLKRPDERQDPRPTMCDLRDSGAIEQDADGILLLHRADYYNMFTPGYERDHRCEIIIEKWRDGVRGESVMVTSDLKHQRFLNVAAPDAISLEQQYTGNRNGARK